MKMNKTLQNLLCFFAVSLALVALGIPASRLILSSAASAEAQNKPTVIIDAGHGGFDGGAVADDGTLEKDLNLAVAKRLEALFLSAGVNVVMTRCEDISLDADAPSHKKAADLKARVEVGRANPKALFLSIHMNKFPVKKYSGLQVYYASTPGSREIAGCIQRTVFENLQMENTREIKSAGSEIFVLDKAETTAVLVECGFLSCESELSLLKSDEYQKSLATCIFSAVINSIEINNTDV